MSANKQFRLGPVLLTTVMTTNLLNPPTAAGGVNAGAASNFITMKHLRVTNKTGVAATVSLWIGATGANAAGTEFVWQAANVPANDSIDWYSQGARIEASQFLVGGAGTTTSLVLTGEGEIGVA